MPIKNKKIESASSDSLRVNNIQALQGRLLLIISGINQNEIRHLFTQYDELLNDRNTNLVEPNDKTGKDLRTFYQRMISALNTAEDNQHKIDLAVALILFGHLVRNYLPLSDTGARGGNIKAWSNAVDSAIKESMTILTSLDTTGENAYKLATTMLCPLKFGPEYNSTQERNFKSQQFTLLNDLLTHAKNTPKSTVKDDAEIALVTLQIYKDYDTKKQTTPQFQPLFDLAKGAGQNTSLKFKALAELMVLAPIAAIVRMQDEFFSTNDSPYVSFIKLLNALVEHPQFKDRTSKGLEELKKILSNNSTPIEQFNLVQQNVLGTKTSLLGKAEGWFKSRSEETTQLYANLNVLCQEITKHAPAQVPMNKNPIQTHTQVNKL